MHFETLRVNCDSKSYLITLNRSQSSNSINSALLQELNQALTEAEQDGSRRLIILEGSDDCFCTGMHLQDLLKMGGRPDKSELKRQMQLYLDTLRRFTLYPKPILCKVKGAVLAGGVGLVAASDLVIADRSATFSLSEALWGFLPATVLPYLIRRIGFQKAYWMTLTSQTINAAEAEAMHLVDYLAVDVEATVDSVALRLQRLTPKTIKSLKSMARELWAIPQQTEQLNLEENFRLASDEEAQAKIRNFVESGQLPWEGDTN